MKAKHVEAMKLALEALETSARNWPSDSIIEAITALREALEKPDFWEGYVPEPVKPATEESSATQAQQALDKKADNAMIYKTFEQWMNGDFLEVGEPRKKAYSEDELLLVEMGWNYGYDAGRAVEQALDKKADNARELGLDYEPIVEQVEDSVGMGHGAWDMVEPKKLAKAFHEALAEPPCKTGSQCTNKCPQCDEPAQQQRWAVFCSQCRKEWSVSYPHPGKSICAECDAKVGAQQQKEGFASPGGGYVPAIPRPIPLDWKLVPRKATPEMLRAMDECAQEGYDERLYEGMASSVYMAAWDASPVLGTLPPSEKERSMMDIIVGNLVREGINKHRARELAEHFVKHTSPPASKPWVGLTDDEIEAEFGFIDELLRDCCYRTEAKLREKNA